MSYVVRAADAVTDGEILRDLDRLIFPGHQAPILTDDEIEDALWWLVFDAAGHAVGFAGMEPHPGRVGYLSRSGVLPEHRGNGLHRRLIRARERTGRQRSWKTLWADTNKNVTSANNFIACGFHLFAPKEPWGFATSLYWRKHL